MAILKFRVYWEDDESVYRDIVAKHKQTFLDLHEAILKSYEFDNKHDATFYKSNDNWQYGREITKEKYLKTYKVEPLIMNDVSIGSQIADPNQKFIFQYDFTKNWTFMMELIGVEKEADDKIEYPTCIRKEGLAPSQYGTKGIIDSRLAEMEEKYDLQPDALREGYGEEGEETDGDFSDSEEGSAEDTSDEF
ncbi:MAG: plasmid pRiA4b ORF-3 family protein [Ferruginibacter sp.]|nr:plasmid pRiA4b ORF-3 family protein [Ferruginibacter sp.]